METEYNYGAIVHNKADSAQKMIVRRAEEQAYYCRMLSNLGQDGIGYPQDELEPERLQNPYS